jgi:hypothetical protein
MTEHSFEKSKPYSYFTGCPDGYHKRKSYKTKTGKKVPTRCVKSTTTKKETSAEFKKSITAKQSRRLKKLIPSIRSLSRKACPPGMIERKEYARRYTTAVLAHGFSRKSKAGKISKIIPNKRSLSYVGPKCVKDVGLPGKGNQGASIGPLRKGELTKYGYTITDTEEKRHKALKKAVEEYGALGVYRKLDAVAKLTVRTIPEASKKWASDRDWIKVKYGPLKAF